MLYITTWKNSMEISQNSYFLVWFQTKNIFWTKNRKCIKRNEEIPKTRLKFQTKRGFHWKIILCYSKNRAVWIIVRKKCYIFCVIKNKKSLISVIYHIILQILLCITHIFHQFLCYLSHKERIKWWYWKHYCCGKKKDRICQRTDDQCGCNGTVGCV